MLFYETVFMATEILDLVWYTQFVLNL